MTEEKFEFIFTGPLTVEESFTDRAVLSGVFLRLNKVTTNGREYQVEEGKNIADGLVGMPVGMGTNWLNKHNKGKPFHVGRVIAAWLDKAINAIRGKVEVWNTAKFPDIVQRIRKGWGFSIGGKAADLRPTGVLNKLGKAVMKVIGMRPNHLQLLEPETSRGQQEAVVDDIQEVEESLSFDPCPWGVCELPEESTDTDVPDTDTGEHNDDTITAEDIISSDLPDKIVADEIVGKPLPTPKKRKIYILMDSDSRIV